MWPERRQTPGAPSRVLLIGWDAADWQIINPLIDQGLMPTLKALIEQGSSGNLATTRPILSPILWNTIATGKRASAHGVYGFTEPNPDGSGVRPVASTSRKCKALWNILTQSGLKSNVVGWYASHPAEPINGVMVSNQFEQVKLEEGRLTPPAAHSVHPEAALSELAEFRVLQEEIDAGAILPFVPRAAEILERDKTRLGKLQHMLAQTATVHAVATHLIANTSWDLTAIYYEGIDRFGHEFMEFHPPKMEQVPQEDFEHYQACMVGIYRFHDMLLDTLLQLAGDDTAVIVMSDHGYFNDHLRPDPREDKSGPVDWHRPFGIFAAQGRGILADNRVYGASILDIAPTILQLLGLPAGYDMPGRVLAEALENSQLLDRVESWEEIEGECGMHAADLRTDPEEAQVVLQQLAALGYIEAPSDDVEKTIKETITCNQFNLLQSLMDERRFEDAIKLMDQFDATVRNEEAAQILMANCLLGLGDRMRAREILENLCKADTDQPRVHMMLGALEFADGNPQAALAHLEQVVGQEQRLPGLHNKLGEVYLEQCLHQKAIDAFEEALKIDCDSPVAYAGLARAWLEQGEPQKALDNALVAAELVHFFPRVHYVIGKALLELGDVNGAVEALELCIRQAPQMNLAHKALVTAYRNQGRNDKAMAAELKAKGVLA